MKCKIAICGSDEASRAIFSDRLKSYDASCQLFSSPESLSGALRYYLPDVLFIRAELGDERISACVSSLRAAAPDCSLLLVSGSSRGAALGFSLRADGFLLAPVSQQELDAALEYVFGKRPWVFRTLSPGAKKPSIPVSEILYIESRDHYCLIHGADGELTQLRASLRELEPELADCGFFRCHRCFLVNLRHARSLERGCFILENASPVPISAKTLPAAEAALGRLRLSRMLCERGCLY